LIVLGLIIFAIASVSAQYEKTTYTIGTVYVSTFVATSNVYMKTDFANSAIISCTTSDVPGFYVWVTDYNRKRVTPKKVIGEYISQSITYYAGEDQIYDYYRVGYESYTWETGNANLKFAP